MPDPDCVWLRFGSQVRGLDGRLGKLADAVVEPSTLKVTHVIVKPPRFARSTRGARLAPFELVRAERGRKTVSLACKRVAFRRLFAVEEGAYVPIGETVQADGDWDVGVTEAVLPPVDSTGGYMGEQYPIGYACFSYDLMPKGEAEVRRMSAVTAKDGTDLGGVGGLLTDERGSVTGVLLAQRRIWGKRQLAIPVSAVRSIETDEVKTTLTRHDAEHLGERQVQFS